MAEFKVGDICVGQNLTKDTSYNGMECEVIGPLEMRPWRHISGATGVDLMYRVLWATGERCAQAPHELRKRRPPSTDEATAQQAMLDCIQKAKMPIKERA